MSAFEIDGIRFVQDFGHLSGGDWRKSAGNEFLLVKTDAFLDFYRSLANGRIAAVLEVGMFEGGSLVFFDKIYKPKTLVGIDIRTPIDALELYRTGKPHIRTYYRTSQDDPAIANILQSAFPEGIDLIVDDASHQYEASRATFHLSFPFLKPGGLYVLEDWSWSHEPNAQEPSHPWYGEPSLTNLIIDFVCNLPNNPSLKSIMVYNGLAVVEKGGGGPNDFHLDAGYAHFRDRSPLKL